MSLATRAPPPSSSCLPRQCGDNASSTMQLAVFFFFVCLNSEQEGEATKERARKAQGFASYRGWPES